MTKRISAVVLALLMCILTLAFSVTSFSAAENLKLNGKVNAKVGDKVTYEFCVSDVPEKVEDIQMQVAYDSQYLKVDPDKVEYLDGGSSVYNTNLKNEVLFNSANGVQGWDMKEKTMILSLTFEVLQGGSTDITYYVQCFDYQSNSQNVDTLQFTTDFLVNGKTAKRMLYQRLTKTVTAVSLLTMKTVKVQKTVVTTQSVVSTADITPTISQLKATVIQPVTQ